MNSPQRAVPVRDRFYARTFALLTALVLVALWIPLGGRLADGHLSELSTAVLLLGFIWIWLVLVILAGVVQARISAWWTSALGPESGGAVS